ncbi:hypothetical protein BOTBODRAFT_51187 [Botryobasidium botryosum FD-172 SS1]|uniref:Kinesin motor domain-containing protein n=1 Tax=Botryobasidium botryosum (strain FD-172 SS1) TaxID=930990 RepID=A0A067N6P4_BOTB1|nr:hypothetical protein BOTBODRAFT_51187 [Botryobasidium botryosum FD-172 SS1]
MVISPSPSGGNTTSIQVALRIRPTTSQDLTSIPSRFQRTALHALSPTSVAIDAASTVSNGGPVTSSPSAPSLKGKHSTHVQTFTFDQVHSPETTQYEMFTNTASPLISRFIEGFNCTILAYGQTSSGKTHTMTGTDLDADPNDPTNSMGIIPRAVSTIFKAIRDTKEEKGSAWRCEVKGSFIELYNEDLIDLLGVEDSTGLRREVQIREDKDGNIIWGGLREVPVRNAADVMTLIKQGSSLRRTNETDMNAQSSRSHAIFSLTMTQKRYVGTSPIQPSPVRYSSANLSPGSGRSSPAPGNSPSRLARPGSMYARVGSPTSGRPPTPSFASAMARASIGLRPGSSMGNRPSSPDVEEKGDWVTVVSKFNFVDLAGSERLKRTAAVGDRIKEGISINSGLLALGNVISALGDPARSRALTHGGASIHVPYRDSKLTRLLQDSLGGNAHTLMIACVSAAEWNVAETLNTLKYANRARNIKNRAEVKETEVGWDDMEWLQGMVTKLRRELKSLKEGGAVPDNDSPVAVRISPSPSRTDYDQGSANGKVLKQYTELQLSYEELRASFVERNDELTRLRRELEEKGSSGNVAGGMKRYEEIVGPVIEEYEKTISAIEAELKLNRTALHHTNEMFEEQEQSFAQLKERNVQSETYIEELRARVSKLTEREASTESYVRDLETKLKAYSDASASSSESLNDLRKEIARHKENEASTATYISELEARLAKSDADILALRGSIEKLEETLSRRDEEMRNVEARLEAFLQEKADAEGWKASLEEREKRVEELEKQLEEWESVRKQTKEERERLNGAVSEVEEARRSLEMEVAKHDGAESITTEDSDVDNFRLDGSAFPLPPVSSPTRPLREQMRSLQQSHSETLKELASVTSKYQDALVEISELVAQISDAKGTDTPPDSQDILKSPRTPTGRRRPVGTTIITNGLNGRPLFRHAASADSLHSRSLSQSLSQDVSPQTLKQSWAEARQSWAESASASGTDSLLSPRLTATTPRFSLIPLTVEPTRSVDSLEKEIMRLQEVLKEREAEIGELETTIQRNGVTPSTERTGLSTPLPDVQEEHEDVGSPIMNGKELSPSTSHQWDELRRSMELHSESDASLGRLDELMRAMAQKESHHKEVVDALTDQLEKTRKQHEELTALSRDQAMNMSSQALKMSTEIENLRAYVQETEGKHTSLAAELEQLRNLEASLKQSLDAATEAHAKEMDQLRADHQAETGRHEVATKSMLDALAAEHADALTQAAAKHERELQEAAIALQSAREMHEGVAKQLESTHRDSFALALSKSKEDQDALHAQHQEQIRAKESEIDTLTTQMKAHEDAIYNLRAEHGEALERLRSTHSTSLSRALEDHEAAISKLKLEHEQTLRSKEEETAELLAREREEHAAALKRVDISREGLLSESQSAQASIIQRLEEEHTASYQRKEAAFNADLEKARAEHARQLASREDDHTSLVNKLRSEHAADVERLKKERADEVAKLVEELEQSRLALQASQAKHQEDLETAVAQANEQHQLVLEQSLGDYDQTLAKLREDHRAALAGAQESMTATEEQHRDALADAHREYEVLLLKESEEHSAALDDLKAAHADECEMLRTEHALAVDEVAALKSANEQASSQWAQKKEELVSALHDKDIAISQMQDTISSVQDERSSLAEEVERLRAELEATRNEHSRLAEDVSKRDSIADELERHRSVLSEVQNDLQRTKDERDNLLMDKARHEQVLRDLQAQISGTPTPRAADDGSHIGSPRATQTPMFARANGLPPSKLPPLTPPPSIPPPPVPTALPSASTDGSISSRSTANTMSTSSQNDPSSPMTSPSTSAVLTGLVGDSNLAAQIEEQSRRIDDQDAMIKTLNKQLLHCESDLQAHMDLVATLETSLTDSERNLRKTRLQANEFSKERDALVAQTETLRVQLAESQQEVASVRRSIQEEKLNLESRLSDERRQKERAKAQLDSRMEEMSRRKSKFACM